MQMSASSPIVYAAFVAVLCSVMLAMPTEAFNAGLVATLPKLRAASMRPSVGGSQLGKSFNVAQSGANRLGARTGLTGLHMAKIREKFITHPVRVCVLGGGNFGCSLAWILGSNKHPVTLLVRRQEVADHINKHHKHPQYLKDIELPACVCATTDPQEALKDASYIVHSVPVQYSRQFLKGIKDIVKPDTPVICTSKGIETGTLSLMQDILREELGDMRDYAFLSGPSFAREIATGLETAVVVASESDTLANEAVDIFSCKHFRVFTSNDVKGVEIGGAVKNVIAIAAGMCEGLGLGTNAMSALVTRGVLEMNGVAKALGAKATTLNGLAGVGDTFGTCFGPLSRNRQLGFKLGQGEKLEDILASSTEVAEGYATAFSLVAFVEEKLPPSFRKDLKFPILFGVAEILKGNLAPREGMEALMTNKIRTEIFDMTHLDDDSWGT